MFRVIIRETVKLSRNDTTITKVNNKLKLFISLLQNDVLIKNLQYNFRHPNVRAVITEVDRAIDTYKIWTQK